MVGNLREIAIDNFKLLIINPKLRSLKKNATAYFYIISSPELAILYLLNHREGNTEEEKKTFEGKSIYENF